MLSAPSPHCVYDSQLTAQSRVADTLIILLHCATVTHTPLDLDFALVPALKLAEGGRNMRERRMGAFVCLCLVCSARGVSSWCTGVLLPLACFLGMDFG